MILKHCGRCKNSLECNREEISSCACSQVELSSETRHYLAKTNYDCLCKACLTELNDIVNHTYLEKESDELINGKHFYLEDGFMVFTEQFHIARGYCCKSNCRHCAYGFQEELK